MAYSNADARPETEAENEQRENGDAGVSPDPVAIREGVINRLCDTFPDDHHPDFNSFAEMAEYAQKQTEKRINKEIQNPDAVQKDIKKVIEDTFKKAQTAFMKSPNLKEHRTDGVFADPQR